MVSIETLEKIGSKWVHPKTGEVRYYVNDCWKYGGLYVERYNSGNICYSELNSEEISHTKADGLIISIQKCWITEDGEVHLKGYLGHEEFNDAVIAGIKAAIAEMEAPETVTETSAGVAQTSEAQVSVTSSGDEDESSTRFILVRDNRDWEIFDTYEEAEQEAEYLWDRKTKMEKADMSIFQISRCDEWSEDDPSSPADSWDFDENCIRDFVREWRNLHDNAVLRGASRGTRWVFDDCTVIRDGDSLKVIMEGPYDYRMMEIRTDDIERDVAALESGSSPVGDGWEDGTGRTVCYDNGVLCDEDGNEVVDVAFVWNRQTYHIRVYDVEGDVWRSLAAHDGDEGDDLSYHLEPQDVIGVNDVPAGAHLIDSWDDVDDFPDESLDDFLCEIMAEEDGAAEMIERAAGDVLEAAKRFVSSYFEGADEDSLAHEQQLRYYRMTPHELAGWLAREWEGYKALKEITATLKVAANGYGLMITCTREMRALGLDRGDMVEVTFRRLRIHFCARKGVGFRARYPIHSKGFYRAGEPPPGGQRDLAMK